MAVLTERERQVLELASVGATNAAVGALLGISTETVKSHLKMVRAKLGAKSTMHAVAIAFRDGLLV